MMARPGTWLARTIAVLAAWAGVALIAVPAVAAPQVSSPNVKYYVVQTSYRGQPEQLREIAERMLGSEGRAKEILDLNYGRLQPDGGRLSNPNVLHAGWVLVLPWDAVGPEVVLGPLPKSPAPSATPGPTTRPSPPPATPAALSSCTPTRQQGAAIPWPQLRLAPDLAWASSRGNGVTIAVIDLPIDASVPALAGRVSAAVTIGSGRSAPGSVCRDHGTGMAAIIVGQPTAGIGLVGIAPEATILPVTVDVVDGRLEPSQVAKGIAAGVRSRAEVVMVAAVVDLGDRQVAAAVDDAIAHDVAVVVGADPAGDRATARPGLLRVGAAAADDTLAVPYRAGAVDVIAPGAAVTTVGGRGTGAIEGTGTDFAVPFAAGLVALIRSASRDLSAVSATQRVETSADRNAAVSPADSPSGWGMIDLSAAVTDLPAAATNAAAASPAATDGRVLITGGIAALLIAWFAVVRLRRATAPPVA